MLLRVILLQKSYFLAQEKLQAQLQREFVVGRLSIDAIPGKNLKRFDENLWKFADIKLSRSNTRFLAHLPVITTTGRPFSRTGTP